MEKRKETKWGLRKKGTGVVEEFPQVLMALIWGWGLVIQLKRVPNLGLNLDFLVLDLTVNSLASS